VKGYGDFVRTGAALPSVWKHLKGQIYLGSEAFVERLQSLAGQGDLAEIPRAQRCPLARPLAYYRDSCPDRRQAMAAAYASGRYTMHQIAQFFGVHYATVSRAVKRREEMQDCKT